MQEKQVNKNATSEIQRTGLVPIADIWDAESGEQTLTESLFWRKGQMRMASRELLEMSTDNVTSAFGARTFAAVFRGPLQKMRNKDAS